MNAENPEVNALGFFYAQISEVATRRHSHSLMGEDVMLASIKADTSLIEEKLTKLLEMLPEHVPDHLLGVIAGLTENVIFVDGPATVCAGGSFDLICVLDFDTAAYSEVVATARAMEFDNITH